MKVTLLLLLVAASISYCHGGDLTDDCGLPAGGTAGQNNGGSSSPSIAGFSKCVCKGLVKDLPATLHYLEKFTCEYAKVKKNGIYENPGFQKATTELVNFFDDLDCSFHELTGINADSEQVVEMISTFTKTTADDLIKVIGQMPHFQIITDASCLLVGVVVGFVGPILEFLGITIGEVGETVGQLADPLLEHAAPVSDVAQGIVEAVAPVLNNVGLLKTG